MAEIVPAHLAEHSLRVFDLVCEKWRKTYALSAQL